MKFESYNTSIDYNRLEGSKILFPKYLKNTSIFHYTSIGGLDGIFQKQSLWFTNILFLNDRDEITAGSDCLRKKIDTLGESKLPIDYPTNLESISDGFQTFICCFSLNGDSLPMWNYYTKDTNNQGYNVEFGSKYLVESILKQNKGLDGCDLSFGVVDYSEDNTSKYSNAMVNGISTSVDLFFTELLRDIIERIHKEDSTDVRRDAIQQLGKEIKDAQKKKNLSHLPIYSYNGKDCKFEENTLFNFLPFVKRDCFKPEQEFRIVITVPNERLSKLNDDQNGIYKFRISNGIMVPYLELKFIPDPKIIKSITISPTVQSDLVEQSIEEFMNYCNFKVTDYSKFIKHSDIPVRF